MNAPPRPGDVLTRELNGKPRPICHGFSRLRGGKKGKKKKQNKCKHPSAFLLCVGTQGGTTIIPLLSPRGSLQPTPNSWHTNPPPEFPLQESDPQISWLKMGS